MSRITKAFSQKAKVAYLTAGDGGKHSIDYFLALAKAGANVLEIGIPFSDPIADGPVIQLAMERALKACTYLAEVITLIHDIRAKTEAALIVFTYFNPIMADLKKFLQQIKQAGADGILIVDLPLEESMALQMYCEQLGLALIMVAAPSTPMERIRLLSEKGEGFLYYACRKGTTGIKQDLPEDILEQIKQVKAHSSLPVAIGFGVANHTMVEQLLTTVADGCVVGSYFVDAIAQGKTAQELEQLAREIFYVN